MLVGADVFIGVRTRPGHNRNGQNHEQGCCCVCLCQPDSRNFPEDARAGGARLCYGTGDYPNQINNVLAFPGIFRGAFDVRARDINEEMKIAAARTMRSYKRRRT